jgi:hypothetical protein
MRTVERAADRKELVREAGLRETSFTSVLAGTMVAFGTAALLLAVAGAVAQGLGLDTNGLSTQDWKNVGIGSVIAVGVVMFLAYFFGGYTAGRMARRAGGRPGVMVFVLALVLMVVGAVVAGALTDRSSLLDNLRNQGVPTSWDAWSGVGIIGGIAMLAAMLLGGLFGGLRGERWHGKLVTRAADPRVLPRDEVDEREEEGRERVTHRLDRDEPVDDARPVDDTRVVDVRDEATEPAPITRRTFRARRDGDVGSRR